MSRSPAAGLGSTFLGVAIAALNPLGPLGSPFGPGWGDILNGEQDFSCS